MKLLRSTSTLLAATAVLTGCSGLSELVYDNKRHSAERRCQQQVSKTQHDDCRGRALPAYDQYEQQRQTVTTGTNQQAAARKDAQTKRDESLCFTRQSTGERVCPN
jgi:outer membrane biogenesis lipoprotein LolB